MAGSRSYSALLDAIGLYLEERGASDTLVDEIEGGYLVGFLAGDQQQVVTMTTVEVDALQARSRHKSKIRGWTISSTLPPPLRARLRALGRYLDKRTAASIVVQERDHGFSVEFTGVPQDDLDGLIRIYETVDDRYLRQLLT